MQTHKRTAGQVYSIFPRLVWHTIDKKKKRSNKKFKRKSMLSLLLCIRIRHTTTVIDPVSKTVYKKIQIGMANNIYNKLMNDDKNTPTTCKTS